MNPEHCQEEENRFLFTVDADPTWLSGYILSYGKNAELLEPASIREEIRQILDTLSTKYFEE